MSMEQSKMCEELKQYFIERSKELDCFVMILDSSEKRLIDAIICIEHEVLFVCFGKCEQLEEKKKLNQNKFYLFEIEIKKDIDDMIQEIKSFIAFKEEEHEERRSISYAK